MPEQRRRGSSAKSKEPSSNVSKFQAFETDVVNRADLRGAEYNPRIMDKGAQKRLKAGLKKHGLVQPIVWNRRTGNVVGGHQRLSQLDALERRDDYDLTVSVIDVDEREEAEINIQLNNPSMQGDWDYDLLADVAEQFSFSFDEMGFSDTDIDILFDGDDRFSELFDVPEVEEMKDDLEQVKEARAEGAERLKERNGISFYDIVIFADEEERRAFHQRIHVPECEEYVTVEQIERIKRE